MKALKENSLKKGDALSTARIAAILSAKKTSDLIPLCHQIPLSNVQVKFFFEEVCLKILLNFVKKIFDSFYRMQF